jgi:tripartite-type tricarboxylate transporter receptor subunit TctC
MQPIPFMVRRLGLLAATALLSIPLTPARAQVNTGKSIRLIVPFAAASSTDAVARAIAPGLGEKLGVNIIVDDRPGANGVIAADLVAKAAPDGLTFLVGSASVNAANPSLFKTLPYDPVKDLVPVGRIGINPFMVVVNPGAPFHSMAGLVDYARKNPGKLAFGTPNSVSLVAMETFKRREKLDILTVPYKSSLQVMTDLIANQIQLTFADFVTAMPKVTSGQVRVLAVTTLKRSTLLPDVPPVSDTSKDFDFSGWSGLFAPRGTPPEVVARVSAALQSVLSTREMAQKLAVYGLDISNPIGYQEFGRYVPEQIQTWRTLIKDAGVQPE